MNSSRNEDMIGFKPDVFVYLILGFGGKTRMNNMIKHSEDDLVQTLILNVAQ